MKLCRCWFILVLLLVPGLQAASEAPEDAAIKAVEKKVTTHLNSYFMIHSIDGVPSSARPSKVEIDIDTTEVVEGWVGRLRTTGTATVTTASVQSENYACTFDVLSQLNDKNRVTIVSTTVKRKY